jgi:hypothetical protein
MIGKIQPSFLGFMAIILVAAYLGLKAGNPEKLVMEPETKYDQTIAAGIAVLAQTPEPTPTKTVTPTKVPGPPTRTPQTRWRDGDPPGVYIVPKWTPTPPSVRGTPTLPECDQVTPVMMSAIECRVV